jgi:pre-mRNA-splicing factor SYF1
MEEDIEERKIEIEKDAGKHILLNNFDLSSMSQSFINEEEILNKLQEDISEYTNYDNIQNPYNFKSWWDTLSSSKEAPFSIRKKIYLVSLHYLPGSYKLWYNYLKEEREYAKANYNIPNKYYDEVNKLHEQALIYMMKMPKIWIDFIQFMFEQNLITKTKTIFNKALQAIPITQHKKLWDIYIPYIESLSNCHQTKIEIFKRYIKFNPDYKEKFINFLIGIKEFNTAIYYIIEILNDENFYSKENKSQYYYWIILCQIINNYPEYIDLSICNKELNVDRVIRHGIKKYSDEVGNLWVTLANYYIKIGLIEKAREIFEEALEKILTVRDFSLVFNSYLNFEQEMMKYNIFNSEISVDNNLELSCKNGENEENKLTDLELNELENAMNELKFEEIKYEKIEEDENIQKGDTENNSNIKKFNFIRVNNLLQRRPFLLNSTILRRNPNNVNEWLKRIELMKEKNDFNQIKKLYEECLNTIKINEAYGKLSEIYISYANFYEENNNIKKANEIYFKGCNLNYKKTEENVTMWCLWCEMNIRQKKYKDAYSIIKYICTNNTNKYYKYNKNIKLWSLYIDLEINMNKNNEKQVIYIYNKMIEFKIANIETIFNFIIYLEKIKYYEKIYNIYEQSIELFTWPNAYDICLCYLVDFINHYKNEKSEIFRDIIQNIIVLSGHLKIFYYIYAFYEEKYGLYNHCIDILKEASQNVKDDEKPEIHSVIIAKSAKYFGIGKVRLAFDDAMNNLDKSFVLEIGLKYISIEIKLKEINRARGIFKYLGKLFNPDNKEYKEEFWEMWDNFEKLYGDTVTYQEMKNELKLSQLRNNP